LLPQASDLLPQAIKKNKEKNKGDTQWKLYRRRNGASPLTRGTARAETLGQ
jgi:hypothetical protein